MLSMRITPSTKAMELAGWATSRNLDPALSGPNLMSQFSCTPITDTHHNQCHDGMYEHRPNNGVRDWLFDKMSPPQAAPISILVSKSNVFYLIELNTLISIDRKSTRLNSSHLGISY